MEAPLILSHESALLYHRAARLGRPPRVDDVTALATFIGTTSKLDVLVLTADKRLRDSWAHSHVCAGIDTDALALPAANGIRVCVPELALWQLAQKGDVVRTALLAMGYRVIHVTRRQVNDYDLYQGLMEAIRLALGVRLALPSPRMLERREALWRRLYGVRRGERQPFSVR